MAATNIGYTGSKLEFQSSVLKKNTDFYRNYVSGKLNDENFKWPECPWKFVTKNHLIGAIQSPDRSEIEYGSNDVPQSPCSSNSVSLSPRPSTSNQLMSDMVKLVKGEAQADTNNKGEVKVETTAVPNPVPYTMYPYGIPYGYPFNPMNMTMNPAMMPMPNMLPNMSMVGMPPHATLQVHIINRIQNISFAYHPFCYNWRFNCSFYFFKPWGGVTPAQNPTATPLVRQLNHLIEINFFFFQFCNFFPFHFAYVASRLLESASDRAGYGSKSKKSSKTNSIGIEFRIQC